MKKTLAIVLLISAVIELALGAGVLIAPAVMMEKFGVFALNDEILYLAAIVGWFCLLTGLAAAIAAAWVRCDRPEGRTLSILLGVFWIGIGLHLALGFGRPQHFILDAAKGLVILLLAYFLPTKKSEEPPLKH